MATVFFFKDDIPHWLGGSGAKTTGVLHQDVFFLSGRREERSQGDTIRRKKEGE